MPPADDFMPVAFSLILLLIFSALPPLITLFTPRLSDYATLTDIFATLVFFRQFLR